MATPIFTAPERPDVADRVGDPRMPLDPALDLGAKLSASEIERAEDDIDLLGILADPKARTSPVIFDRAVGSLGVLGYGQCWLARKLGLPVGALAPGQRRILPYRMRLVLGAAIRIGSRWATPESTGQTAQEIETVQQQAARRGFGVPVAYGSRYEPEAESVLDAPMAQMPKDVQRAKIEMLAYFCNHGGTAGLLARRFGLSTRTVGRARKDEVGLQIAIIGPDDIIVARGQDDLVAAIYQAADALTVEDPRVVWKRLRAFAAERIESERAGQGGSVSHVPLAMTSQHGDLRKEAA